MTEQHITTATFRHHLESHKLTGSRSGKDRPIFIPPRPIDPEHVNDRMELVELSGRGRLVSFSVVPTASSEMIAAGYGRDNPYCVGIVQLDEGPSISAQIVGVDTKNPASIAIGTAVRAEYIERAAGEKKRTVLAFAPEV
jgi:uncharacterized protein